MVNHTWWLLRYVREGFSQLKDYIPRPEFATITKKISDDIVAVRSGVAEKFAMVVGKLTGLERRVENLESSGGEDSRTRNEVRDLAGKVRDITVECGSISGRGESFEREMREKMSAIDRLLRRMDQIDETVALNTVKIADMESDRSRRPRKEEPMPGSNGTLLWKIESYQRKRQDAINGVKAAIYSPPFYSAKYGYKMCAKIYMNGDGFGKGTHLSLFFVLMRGEHDAIQTWPFQKKITMMLLDQGEGDHMIDAFHSDPSSSSFQRPRSDMNIASGSPLFMPLASLNNRQYIKDDVMFMKIIVD